MTCRLALPPTLRGMIGGMIHRLLIVLAIVIAGMAVLAFIALAVLAARFAMLM